MALIGLHLGLVLMLQLLGTVRATQSWLQNRDKKLKEARKKKEREALEDKKEEVPSKAAAAAAPSSSSSPESGGASSGVVAFPPAPAAHQTFVVAVTAANAMELFNLALEFVQLATFPFEGLYVGDGHDDDGDGNNDDDDDDDDPNNDGNGFAAVAIPAWLRDLRSVTYVDVPALRSSLGMSRDLWDASSANESQWLEPALLPAWAAVAAVGLLVVLFALQFLVELRAYGLYLRHAPEKLQEAGAAERR